MTIWNGTFCEKLILFKYQNNGTTIYKLSSECEIHHIIFSKQDKTYFLSMNGSNVLIAPFVRLTMILLLVEVPSTDE